MQLVPCITAMKNVLEFFKKSNYSGCISQIVGKVHVPIATLGDKLLKYIDIHKCFSNLTAFDYADDIHITDTLFVFKRSHILKRKFGACSDNVIS